MRYRAFLIGRYRTIFYYCGSLLLLMGGLLLPLLLLPFFPAETPLATGFVLTSAVLLGAGGSLRFGMRGADLSSLNTQEGTVIVLASWLIACLAGTVPFMTALDLNFTQALFEATSGWTTTGLSVVDVEAAPRLMLFYRSFLQMAGGAGFAIIALSVLTESAGAGLSAAEGRADQLAPHVRQSASIVLQMYFGYIVLGVVALRLVGMSWFEAVNHAFAAVSTGGFSTRAASIGYWDSPAVEAVIIVLMLLGTINFLIAFMFMRRKFRPVVNNGELRLLIIAWPLAVLLLVGMTATLYPSLEKGLRVAVFETVSALSTTGFATVSYSDWPEFGWMVLILLMLMGGGTGSTAGGIKQLRIYVLLRGLIWEVQRMFLPRHTVNEPVIWQGQQRVFLQDRQLRRVALFVFLYMLVCLFGSLMVAAHGYSIGASLFEFTSTLSTVGLSVGVITADAPLTLLWTHILGMFLGRLEILAVIVGVVKLTADSRSLLAR